jgi:hypothetical protein
MKATMGGGDRSAKATKLRPGSDPVVPGIDAPHWVGAVAWALITATGLTLLAIALGPHRIGDYYAESDFYGGYSEGARLLQQGRLDLARYGVVGPVYEVALALVAFVTRDLFAAAEAISIGSAVSALLLWFELLRRRAGALLALVTVALLAANPTFFRYGYSVTTDMLAFLLEAAALFAMLAMRGARAPLLAGVLSALAALTRYSAIALLPGALLCYAWLDRPAGVSRWRALALYLVGFAIVAVPWLVIALRAGTPPGAMLFHDIAYDIYAKARGTTWAEYQTRLQPGFQSLVDVMLRDPGAVLRREGSNLLSHLYGDAKLLLGWPVAALCLAGLLVALADGSWRKMRPLWVVGALLYLTLIPAFYSERYSMALAPFYLTLAGIAATSAWLARHSSVGRIPVPRLLALLAFALTISASVSAQRAALDTVPTEVIPIARVLRARAHPDDDVMAVKSHIAYYSGLRFTPLTVTSRLSELADDCRRRGVEYLYYSWIEANNRPSFWYLLDPEAVVPGLKREAFVSGHPATLDRIGPGFGEAPAWLADDRARAQSASRFVAGMPPEWRWRAHLSLAIAELGEQRFQSALDHAAEVVRARPAEPIGWTLTGDASLRLGDRNRSLAAFERALALEPGNVETRIRLGWVLLGAGQEDRAAEVWRPAAGMTTNRATLERMIELFQARGDAAAARQAREALARQAK